MTQGLDKARELLPVITIAKETLDAGMKVTAAPHTANTSPTSVSRSIKFASGGDGSRKLATLSRRKLLLLSRQQTP